MGAFGLAASSSLLLFWTVIPVAAQSTGPRDWSDWQKYRAQVVHPATTIKAEDNERARRNIEQHPWAKDYLAGLRQSADGIAAQMTPEYVARMIEVTTPGTTGPCPACRAKGLAWHPNGQWSWSPSDPDRLTCSVCKTVFPNDQFPETIVLQSRYDPRQRFTFMGGDTFVCFGYTHERPSLSSIIRGRKVSYMTSQLATLAVAYALTNEPRYAQAAKTILLRFAEVFPKYLVRAGYGYGEIADLDPHVAAERINNLPQDELVYPPNKPDRSLYTGYWSASRIGSSGMDGWWVCAVTQAYDLTCTATDGGAPVYSDDERLRIERDVLLEGSYLAACDPAINNKSVGNRAGAAMVGLCVGHPGLVHFGLEGFASTVDDWFLPDGGTSESPAYAMMTMGGIESFGLAFRDYSDPGGYASADGKRYDHFNACRDTRYGGCWQDLVWTLQGNLRHPPSTDSYRDTAIGASFAELIALLYPTPEHLALLKELAGGDAKPAAPRDAIFYRAPDAAQTTVPALRLPDVVFPFLAQGYLRQGDDGRKALVMLNASDWGGHHHLDSLNLYYWRAGRELLSDLGYLWDHPDAYQTRRTVAHNLVMIDGADQRTEGRGGSFHLFSVTPRVRAMEASSRAYPRATEYRRTVVQVDHGDAGAYVLDIFRAAGGRTRDYVFHGPGTAYVVDGLALAPPQEAARPLPFAVRFHLVALGEIQVDDVSIKEALLGGGEGPELAPNPAVTGNGQGRPAGWGCYIGDGKGDWGYGAPGRGDAYCAELRATAADAQAHVNVALLAGASDGYTGPQAIPGRPGATYHVRFAVRGKADPVDVGVVAWPSDPTSPDDRWHGAVTFEGASTVTAGDAWTTYEGTFSLPRSGLQLDKAQAGDGSQPWRVTWQVDKDYRFAAWSPGGKGERVTIGDGWGQRDYRNTDRGATLPYIIRRAEEPNGSSAFVSLFVGGPNGQELVRGVRLLPLPPNAPAGSVAVAVDTSDGTDIMISAIASGAVSVPSATGEVSTDGRLAVVVSSGGAPAHACLIGGTKLHAPGVDLSAASAAYAGQVTGLGSEKGDSWFVVSGELPAAVVGQAILVTGKDKIKRAYPIRAIRQVDGQTRVCTKVANTGFEARGGAQWEVPVTVAWDRG